jgi:lysophospholipase L1-like esterase
MSLLAVPTPTATTTRRGTLLIDRAGSTTAASIEKVADNHAEALAAAADASSTASDAVVIATTAEDTANSAVTAATVAKASADAATAAASGFPVASFLGTITALGSDPGTAASNSGKWWQIGVAGLLSHANAGGLTVAIGDRILSNGTAWARWIQPATYLPDNSITGAKYGTQTIAYRALDATLQTAVPSIEDTSGYLWVMVDASRKVVLGINAADGSTALTLDPTKDQEVNSITAGGARISEDSYDDAVWALMDASGHPVARVARADGAFVAKLQANGNLTLDGGATVGSDDYPDYLWAVVDSNGKALLRIRTSDGAVIGNVEPPEVVTARGLQSTLSARLAISSDEYGLSKDGLWRPEFLRETRMRLRKLALGGSTTLVAALIGDSWTYNVPIWSGNFATKLRGSYGDAGPGWCGFGFDSPTTRNGCVDPTSVTYSVPTNWTCTYNSASGADISAISPAASPGTVTVTGPAGCSAVKLHWIVTSSGAIRYRFNGGGWSSVSSGLSGLLIVSLTAIPSIAWTLEIEHVSGTHALVGLDIQKAGPGVRVHKLGATGSTSGQWAAANASTWEGGIADLAPNLVCIMLGTNDQAWLPPSDFEANLTTICTRVRAAVPSADILLAVPPENGAGRSTPMSDYALTMHRVAYAFSATFLNLQPTFGLVPADYAYGSSRPWFGADTIHPDSTTGGYAILDAFLRPIIPA